MVQCSHRGEHIATLFTAMDCGYFTAHGAHAGLGLLSLNATGRRAVRNHVNCRQPPVDLWYAYIDPRIRMDHRIVGSRGLLTILLYRFSTPWHTRVTQAAPPGRSVLFSTGIRETPIYGRI